MSVSGRKTTRRTFLERSVTLGGALLAGAAYSRLGSQDGFGATPSQSRLVISRDSNLRSTPTSLDSARLLNCLDRAMQALHDCDSPLEAWRKVARPGEVVGLKVNCLAGRGNSTRPELVDAICERLQQAGIKEIVIWDRLNSDLESARFKIIERGSGIRCFGNDTLGFEDELATFGSVGSLVSKTLTQVGLNARLVRGDIAAEVNRLKEQPGGDLEVSGAGLGAAFMQLGLIDEYWLYIRPIILGGGKPMLAPLRDRSIPLQLVETRPFDHGVVLLKYQIESN